MAPRGGRAGRARRRRAARRSGSPTCAAPSAASCPSRRRAAARDPRRRRRRGRRRARALSRWGASSGAAILWGVAAAAELVNEIGPNFIARPYRGVSVQDVDDARAGRAAARHVRVAPRLPAHRVHRRRRTATSARWCSSSARTATRSSSRVRDARVLAGPDEVAFVADASRRHRQREPARARRGGERARRARVRRRGPLPARQLHLRAGAAADPRRRGRPAAPAEAARDGAHRARLRRGPAAARARLRADRPARARGRAPGRALPVPVPLRRASSSARRSTSSTPARRSPPTGRCVGCERSRQIHAALYGHEPHARVDFCPLLVEGEPGDGADAAQVLPARARDRAGRAARLTVPWGASLEEVRARAASGWPASSGIDLADSVVYGHLWATPETRELFADEGRTRALAATSSRRSPPRRPSSGIIPRRAPPSRSPPSTAPSTSTPSARRRARTGHSTLGLIRVLRARARPRGRRVGLLRRDRPGRHRHLVRARHAADARDRAARRWRRSRPRCSRSPPTHRDTLMLGRTHGQPGLPITFGFKAARVGRRGAPPPRADRPGRAAARRRPARRRRRHALGLGRRTARSCSAGCWRGSGSACPTAAGSTARDRVAEFVGAARADHRRRSRRSATRSTTSSAPRSASSPRRRPTGVVGSITMPQKRNPERSEHLSTLARRRPRRRRPRARGPGRRARARRRGVEDRVGGPPAGLRRRRRRARASPASSSRACGCDAERMRANLDAQRRLRARRAGDARARRARRQAPRARARPPRRAGRPASAGMTLAEALRGRPRDRRGTSPPDRARRAAAPRARARRAPTRLVDERGRARDEPASRPEGYLGADARDPPRPGARAGRRRLRARARRRAAARTAGSGSPTSRTSLAAPDGDPRRRRARAARARCSSCSRRRPNIDDARYGDLVNVRERELEQRVGQRRGLAERGPPAPRGGPDRVPDRAARAAARPRRRDRCGSRAALVDAAARERDTLMPDYTYLQVAQPTTAGHWLLSFAYPALRDVAAARGRLRVGQPQPGRRRRRQRLALRRSTASGSRSCSASTRRSSTRATRCGRPTA